ncbi:hypothetical protein HYW35_03235 [Candidatus Saccharibacteria bacterium]|nr:hypothetical protein [Candidatus Saccharibacteria bacterium]
MTDFLRQAVPIGTSRSEAPPIGVGGFPDYGAKPRTEGQCTNYHPPTGVGGLLVRGAKIS